jgi:hypothetical protein
MFEPIPKICFNSSCNNEATHWIDVIGRVAGYSDHEVPYAVCDECYSFLSRRTKGLNELERILSQNDQVTVERVGARGGEKNPCTGAEVVTTKDLHELLFQTFIAHETEEENQKKDSSDSRFADNQSNESVP